jgi:hypothetical protein
VVLGLAVAVRWAGQEDSDPVTVGWDALSWEATGHRLNDEGLLRRAVDAVGQDQAPRLLFAGEVADRVVVAVGVASDECGRCVATVVDGEVSTAARTDDRYRPIVFDPAGAPLFAPLSLPDRDGAVFLFHPRIGGVELGTEVTGTDTEPLPLEHGVALVPPQLPGSSGCAPLVLQISETTADVHALLGDFISVGITVNGVSEDAREAVAWGIAQGLIADGCGDADGRLTVGDVFGEQTAIDHQAGNLTEPATTNIEVHELYDDGLGDGREGRVLWLEWRRGNMADPDTATVGWQEPSGAVHLAPVQERGDQLAAHRIDRAPGGPFVVITGRNGVRDDLVRVDADGAEVLASAPGVVVLDLELPEHVVTLYGPDDQVLESLVVRSE